MTAIRKFMFDTSFDSPGKGKAKEKPKPEPEPAPEPETLPEPPAPTFSEEDLEAARAEGHAAGRAEAEQMAAQDAVHRLAAAVEKLVSGLDGLFASQAEAAEAARRDAVLVATAITRKLFPHLAERHGLEEVRRVVEDSLMRLAEEPRATIRVGEEVAEPLRDRLDGMVEGLGETVRIVGDDTLGPGDCRVDWSNGGAERDSATLWREVDAIIERNTAAGDDDMRVARGEIAPAAAPQTADPGAGPKDGAAPAQHREENS